MKIKEFWKKNKKKIIGVTTIALAAIGTSIAILKTNKKTGAKEEKEMSEEDQDRGHLEYLENMYNNMDDEDKEDKEYYKKEIEYYKNKINRQN